MKGAYILITKLGKNSRITIGKLGPTQFDRGYYCYVGSARGKSLDIENRTKRHKQIASTKKGKLRWHIDYFLANAEVSIIKIEELENKSECTISKILEKSADNTIRGFGSSDCKAGCKGHLHFFKEIPKVPK